MKLYESEAKGLLREIGIPVPRGDVARSPEDAARIARDIGAPVVIKAQIPVGGRGKAGGIKFADSPDEAEAEAAELLRAEVKGFKISSLLVEERLEIEQELYLGIIVDRSQASVATIVSKLGGVEIEDVAEKSPETITKVTIDYQKGLRPFEARKLAKAMGLNGELLQPGAELILSLYRAFVRYDATIAELNPVALTKDKKLLALDAVLVIDDDALYRHADIRAMGKEDPRATALEALALEAGFSFVELDGDIGIVGNGAGITMATLDLVSFYGGHPANFLDIGGGVAPQTMKRAMEIALALPRLKALLVSIFAGINRCDDIALGIVSALKETKTDVPLVIRLIGTNEERGREILKDAGFIALREAEDAVKEVVALARGARDI